MRISPLLPIVAACMHVVFPVAAAAQREFTFAGIPWHAPAETMRTPLETRGFSFSGTADRRDIVFQRGDGAFLKVELQSGRAVGVQLVDTTRGRRVDARFHALVDSLAATLG